MRQLLCLVVLALGWLGAPAASRAAVDIQVDLSTQTMRVTAKGETRVWAISSARSGYVTPRGTYSPQRLALMHYSRKYDNSPMPHSIFFRGGYAIHGTNEVRSLGRPASHGCIRLAPANAATLYSLVQQEGARITISGSPPVRTMLAKASPKTDGRFLAKNQRNVPGGVGAQKPLPSAAMAFAPSPRRASDLPLKNWLKDPAAKPLW